LLADNWPMPAKIIGELLKSHLEAVSLLGEASHRQALAAWSTADSGTKFSAAQAARLAYEELRHRLEPRRSRPVHFDVGLLVLAVVATGLAMLDLVELRGLLDGPESAALALATTAVWLTIAWLAAVAGRRRGWALLSAIIGVAIALTLLLAALHGFASPPGWPTVGGRTRGSVVLGVLIAVFILVLVTGAAEFIAHMEPTSLLVARRRWHRARSYYEHAVRTQQADLEAAAIAAEAWLGLVRTCVTTIAEGEEQLIGETMTLAAALLESGRPKPP
jgi:hypothetical protein